MRSSLSPLHSDGFLGLYRIEDAFSPVETLIATTPGTRRICNDVTCCGVDYTRLLQKACAAVLKALGPRLPLREEETVVVNILRGGLNYGLRESLADAYGWNGHATSFISAQRARDANDPEAWHITENAYKKVYFPRRASFVIGDVVATGTSLRYALAELLNIAEAQKTDVRSIVFFTYGGPKAREILTEIDTRCRSLFPDYRGTTLVYIEGMFAVPDEKTPLRIRLPGTDLLRLGAVMAPEFIESQYEDPAYPIERCAIYDAGSRAFWLPDYIADVIGYWRQNLDFADRGVAYAELLGERFPGLDPTRFGTPSLKELCLRQINAMKRILS